MRLAAIMSAAVAGFALTFGETPASSQTASPPAGTTAPRLSAPPKPARPPAIASTPEQRSAQALAFSKEPVFDINTYARIKEALLEYADLQVRGGWPTLPADAKLSPGATGANVALLRKRLEITEDIAPNQQASDTYDSALTDGVKHFQMRHGLDPTGSVGSQTLHALNIPVKQRIAQLEASLERLAGTDFPFGEKYVVVNLPAAFVEAVAHDTVERRYRVIVGRADRPSPTLTTNITEVILNPTWTVPLSITKNEIIAKMRKDPSYLSRMHMQVLGAGDRPIDPSSVDWSSDRSPNFSIRQDSGEWNALGNVKIDMPNPYSVYMHDTDSRKLFTADYRFLSHGCTRVDNVRDLAAWLLSDMPKWSRADIDAGIATGQNIHIGLPKKIPVAWIYLTGWMMRDGTIQFRDDVYDQDNDPVPLTAEEQARVADARAGGFVQPRDIHSLKSASHLDSR
ncbi:MAG: L,D-transpeptidase family protein [Xanthobacteraceae bacterium]